MHLGKIFSRVNKVFIFLIKLRKRGVERRGENGYGRRKDMWRLIQVWSALRVGGKDQIWVGHALLLADLLKDITIWEGKEEEGTQYSAESVEGNWVWARAGRAGQVPDRHT